MMQCTTPRRLAAALAAVLLLATPAASRAGGPDAYVADIEDLPLMHGLAEVPDAGVTFDKPAGRIVEAFAHGKVAARDVRAFYRRTLPQLGWTALAADSYAREGEVLTLDFLGRDGDLTVRYTLQPR